MRRITNGWSAPRWAAVLCALTIVVAIGGPLVGRGVFMGADILKTVEPWSGTTPSDFVYQHGPVHDTIDFYAPERELIRDAIIHEHRIPLWNEYANGGTPLGSLPNDGLLSPLEWPMLLFGISFGAAWTALFRLALAALCTAALLRRLGVARLASNCGALVYCMSGFIVAWNNWPQSNIAAWIPALFLTADVAVERRRVRDVLFLGVVVAAMLLEGYPPLLVVTAYALLPFLAIRVWQRPDPQDSAAESIRARVRVRLRSAVPLAAGAIFGAGLAAFQVVPFLLRLSDLNLDYRTSLPHESLPAASLFTTAFPWAIGSPAHPSVSRAAPGFVGTWVFLGAAAVVFLVYGLARGAPTTVSRAIRWWCAATAFVIALPLFADFYGQAVTIGGIGKAIVYKLPLLSQVPLQRFSAVFLFLLSLLVAFGIARLLDDRAPDVERSNERTERRKWLPRALWVGLLIIGLYQLDASFRSEQHVLSVTGQARWILEHSIVSLVIALAAIATIVVVTKARGHVRRVATYVIPVLLSLDAVIVMATAYPRVATSDYFPTNSTIQFLEHNLGPDRFASADIMLFPSAGTYYHLRAVSGHSFSPPSWRELVSVTSPGTISLPTLTLMGHTLTTATSPVLDLLAAKYFVVSPDVVPYGRPEAAPARSGTRVVAADMIAAGSIAGGPLRAVAINVLGPTKFSGTVVYLDATVRDSSGKAVASGTRRLRDQRATTTWYLPVAGELLPKGGGPWHVELGLRSNGADSVPLASTSDSQLALGTVRPADDGLLLAHVDDGALIWQRLNALPRIRWASDTYTELDQYRATLALALAKAKPNSVMLNVRSRPGSGMPAKVTVLQDSPEHIRVAADAKGFGYVVIADAMQSGWTATVDGHTTPIRPADRGIVAIPVGGGHHVVDLRVAPKGWHLGIAISLVSVIAGLVLVVVIAALGRRGTKAAPV